MFIDFGQKYFDRFEHGILLLVAWRTEMEAPMDGQVDRRYKYIEKTANLALCFTAFLPQKRHVFSRI